MKSICVFFISLTIVLNTKTQQLKGSKKTIQEKKVKGVVSQEDMLKETMLMLQEKVENVTQELLSIEQSLQNPHLAVKELENEKMRAHQQQQEMECERHHRSFLLSDCRFMQINIHQNSIPDKDFKMKVFGEQQIDTLDIMSNKYNLNDDDLNAPSNNNNFNCRFGI